MLAGLGGKHRVISAPGRCKPRFPGRIACGWALGASLLLLAAGLQGAPELLVSLSYDLHPALEGCPGEWEFRRAVTEQPASSRILRR